MSGVSGGEDAVNILLVDDQEGNLVSLRAVLEREDYNLLVARTGPEALAQVLHHDIALIVLDVAMPGMDGFEVATTLKQREAYRTIPIIFVTASVQHIEWIFKAYSVGAVDFLRKPLDGHQVRAKVSVFVELYRQRRQIELQAEDLRAQERRAQALEIERLNFQHERRFRSLAEMLPHVVWIARANGELEYVNRCWRQLTGAGEQDARGAGWMGFVHDDDVERLRASWEESIRAAEPFALEFRLRLRTGAYSWQHGRAVPERDNGSGVVRWFGTFTDVDDRRRSHEELRLAVRMRDEFLSVASHELRTPVTALKMRLENLRRTLDERVNSALELAVKQTDRLVALIERLLDASALTTSGVELKLEVCDLASVARDVALGLSDDAARVGSSFDVKAEGPVLGEWDCLRLGQVISNLLLNAIKFGSGKPIDLVVSGDDSSARLSVTDRGIGMAQEQVKRIFGAFERAAPVQHYGGLGLGLFIVAQVVKAHGGRIDVDTRPGEGSTFVVTLPRKPSVAPRKGRKDGPGVSTQEGASVTDATSGDRVGRGRVAAGGRAGQAGCALLPRV